MSEKEPVEEGLGEFPEEVYITYMQDGDVYYPCVYEDLEEVDVNEAVESRCAVYKLVREGTVKVRPSTVKFTTKGTK